MINLPALTNALNNDPTLEVNAFTSKNILTIRFGKRVIMTVLEDETIRIPQVEFDLVTLAAIVDLIKGWSDSDFHGNEEIQKPKQREVKPDTVIEVHPDDIPKWK